MKDTWIISYDVRDAKRLRKIAKTLGGIRCAYTVQCFSSFCKCPRD